MENIRDIKFSVDEGGVIFTFNNNETACLQLPDTGDSQHQINELDDDDWTDKEHEIYEKLSQYYFDSFADTECAAASAVLCSTIEHVEEVYYKNRQIFVAFDDDGNEHLLVESAYKDYYNKRALFAKFDPWDFFGYDEDYSESEIIEKAQKQRDAD